MKKLTLAEIYELQGLKDEALEIYKDMLVQEPENKEAKAGINRLFGKRESFDGVNQKMLNKFLTLNSRDDFISFERWLIEL
jgi:hypothetical protein